MKRRALLRAGAATVPVALAGCTTDVLSNDRGAGDPSTDQPTDSPTGTPADMPTDSPTDTPPRSTPLEEPSVTVVDRDAQPEAPLRYEATRVESAANADRPPRLRVSVTNTSDRELELGEERAVRFHHRTAGDEALYLLPAGDASDRTDADCWRLREPVAVAAYYGTVALGAGETLTAEAAVLGHWDLEDGVCLPAGDHRVETTGSYAENLLSESGDSKRFDWGFTLRVRAG